LNRIESEQEEMEVLVIGTAAVGVVFVGTVAVLAAVTAPSISHSIKTAYRNQKRRRKEKRLFRQLNNQVRQSSATVKVA